MPRRATNIQFQYDEKAVAELKRAIQAVDERIRKKVVRQGIRRWAKETAGAVKAACRPQDKRTRQAIDYTIKNYKRGKMYWAGIGVARQVQFDSRRALDVATKAHFHNGGYRTWAKGASASGRRIVPRRSFGLAGGDKRVNAEFKPGIRMKRDWRKGLRKRNLGPVILKTLYITNPGQRALTRVSSHIEDALTDVLKKETIRG